MVQRRTVKDWTPEVVLRFWVWRSSRPDQLKRYFSRHLGKALRNCLRFSGLLKGRVLDFGCGPGFLLKFIARERDVECEGVDFSPENVAQTEERLRGAGGFRGAHAVTGLPTSLAPDSYDLVTSIEVIEHLDDEQLSGTFQEFHRLLKPSGIAFITTPCAEDLDSNQHYCPFCDSEFHRVQHMRSITAEQLGAELEKARFEVLFCEGIDLHRFQSVRSRRLSDWSLRYLWERWGRRFLHGVAAVADALTRRPLTKRFRFRARATPGSHLVAIARKRS